MDRSPSRMNRLGVTLKREINLSLTTLFLLSNILAFLAGLTYNKLLQFDQTTTNDWNTRLQEIQQQRLLEEPLLATKGKEKCICRCNSSDDSNDKTVGTHRKEEESLEKQKNKILFPYDRVGNYIVGMSRVPQINFTKFLEHQIGLPYKEPSLGEHDVLLIYGNGESLPTTNNNKAGTDGNSNKNDFATSVPFITDAQIATENCDQINIIFTNTQTPHHHCTAIVPQYELQYVQKIIRPAYPTPKQQQASLPNDNNSIISNAANNNKTRVPFKYVSRFHRIKYVHSLYEIPSQKTIRTHWNLLSKFFTNIDTVLAELQVMLEQIAVDKNVIVMVCNNGQSMMLQNFICSARSKGFDLSNVIVFATDIETHRLATNYNITSYYDRGLFGEHPNDAAENFGDDIFTVMVAAKIRCAALVSMLGFNFLFQDVDMIWYKPPLEYFTVHNTYDEYDIYFQEDGARTLILTPYSANSGFYYAKYNARTHRFFISLLMVGDSTIENNNDQFIFNVKLSEHAVLYGLKVKVFQRDTLLFPGGYHYHHHEPTDKENMKQIMNGTSPSYIFHMSWTLNTKYKILFFQQMRQWYVLDNCSHPIFNGTDNYPLQNGCCSVTPTFRCHYRDKPSIEPCPNSQNIDDGAASWW